MTRVTISDVATAAGVSMKSVSRVINREPNVTEKLRERVQSAIDALGYVPDFAARSLAGGKAFTIGLLFHDYGDAFMPSYYPKLQSGAYGACRKNGYHLLVETVQTDLPEFAALFEQALSTMRVDGFILPPPLADEWVTVLVVMLRLLTVLVLCRRLLLTVVRLRLRLRRQTRKHEEAQRRQEQ